MEKTLNRDDLKTRILDAVRDYLTSKGYKNFKSARPGMEKPVEVVIASSDEKIRPDLTAEKGGTRDIFEIELMFGDNEVQLSEKLKAFISKAENMGGKLYLIVPAEKFNDIVSVINDHKLTNIGIIQVNIRSAKESE